MSLTKATYSMIKAAPANVLDYGADPTGVADSTAAFVAAVAANLEVWVPEGTYTVTSAIQLRPGVHIFGANGGQHDDSTVITNATVGGGIFKMVQGTTLSGQLDGCSIENFRLSADFPIRLNDETQLIDPAGPTPAIKRPVIRHCSLVARSSGVGTGISMSKVFGHLIESCRFQGFDISLLMQGCDIGRVVLNRFLGASSYHILEISTNTYGSQNHIENNDILVVGNGATFVKTCSRHVRFYDNYIEQSGGATALGAIDMTNVGCPQYGPNVPETPLSIVCQDNRIDAQSLFSDFIYYLDGTTPAKSIKLYDTGTTGVPAADNVLLKIEGDYLKPVYNIFHNVDCDICVPEKRNYTKFRNTDMVEVNRSGATITPSNVVNNLGFPVNDAGFECGYNGADAIVIKPTMTGAKSPLYIMLPEVSATVEHPLEVGASYEIYITARSPASETLNSSWAVGFTSGGTPTAVALTPDYTSTLVATVAAPAVSDLFGVYFVRSTTTDDIFIRSIQFVRV
jgi:hypothetical protein